MSRHERTGLRDLAFSRWHRLLDGNLDQLDIDSLQYCHSCKETLAVIELYRLGEEWKPASVLKNLGRRLNTPAYCVGYRVDAEGGFCGPLKVERLHPRYESPRMWDLARFEHLIRRLHGRCPWCNYENPAGIRGAEQREAAIAASREG